MYTACRCVIPQNYTMFYLRHQYDDYEGDEMDEKFDYNDEDYYKPISKLMMQMMMMLAFELLLIASEYIMQSVDYT